ncbi:MAG: AfsR/SARP family transcriptional regulator [Fimbriimonas sp.]
MARWRIRLCGGLAVQVDGRSIERFETRRVAALLAYLALHPERGHDRDRVAELLWPGEDVEPQRARFRQALASLRKTLDDGQSTLIQADRVQVRLNPSEAEIDILEFRRHLEKLPTETGSGRIAVLHEAIALEGRDIVPEIPDEWAQAERSAHRDRLCKTILDLATALEEADRPDEAANALSRLRVIDPLREDGAREAVRLLAKASRFGDAAQTAAEYETTLRSQLGVSPSPEFLALADKVRRVSNRRAASVLQETPGTIELPTTVRTAPPLKSNLRPALTPIFGREGDLATIEALLDEDYVRLVTLHGPGGIGKTRLAHELALRARERFDDAVWLIPLAHIQDPGLVLPTVLDAIGAARGTRSETELIAGHLQDRPVLLVLDNLEQFSDVAAEPIQRLLEDCPSVKVVATSRHLLGVGFETVHGVGPLSAADEEDSPGVRLFLERARRQSPTLSYSPEVAELCRQLEGIPLAIALAATRVNVLSAAEMIEQLPQRFELLVSSRRDLPDRHRTLRASLEWSYQLLPDLKGTFARLSVFPGSFDLQAAGVVAQSVSILDEIQLLVERSLVEEEDRGTRKRFRMLETVRQFALDQMSPRESQEARRRHAEYFGALAVEADDEKNEGSHSRGLEIFNEELDNFRAADDWAISVGSSLALKIQAYLGVFWHIRGMYAEARRRYERAFPFMDGLDAGTIARAHNGYGLICHFMGDRETAREEFQRAIDGYPHSDDPWPSVPLNNQANLAFYAGDYERALELYRQAVATVEPHGDVKRRAMIEAGIGNTACVLGRYDEAIAHLEAVLRVNRQIGNRHYVGNNLTSLGLTYLAMGRLDEAERYLRESLEVKRELDYKTGYGNSQNGLAYVAIQRGDLPGALEMIQSAIRIQYEIGNRGNIPETARRAALLACEADAPDLAARLWGFSEQLRKSTGTRIYRMEEPVYERLVGRLQEALGLRYQSLVDEGAKWSLEHAVQTVLGLKIGR